MNLYHHTVIPPVITKLLFRHLIVGLTQMRLALTDISSDPAELCALPQMITLTAQGIAEAAKGSQNQRTEELQREMRSLAFKKMWWKLDKFEAHSNRNLYRYRNTI